MRSQSGTYTIPRNNPKVVYIPFKGVVCTSSDIINSSVQSLVYIPLWEYVHTVVHIPLPESIQRWFIYHFRTESSSGICTTLWTHYAKERVEYRSVNELMGCWYPKWYVYDLWIDSSNGICTTLWTILLKLRVVYIPAIELTSWWYPKGIYIAFWLILAMIYISLYERILFKLRVVYIPVTELTSWWYPKGIYTNFGLILAMVYVPLYERILFNTPTNHFHAQPRSTPNLVNCFLRNVFR